MTPETLAELRRLAGPSPSRDPYCTIKREALAALLDIAEGRALEPSAARFIVAVETSERNRLWTEAASLQAAKLDAADRFANGESVALVARVVAEAVVIVRDL